MSDEKIDYYTQVGMIDLLDSALIDDHENRYGKVRSSNPIRPSSAGKCERAMAYEYDEYVNKKLPVQEKKEANVIRLLDVGHHIERAMIQDFYKLRNAFGVSVKYKDQIVVVAELADGHLVEGEVDFALEGDGFKILCDSKSSKDKFSSHFETQWDEIKDSWARSPNVQVISDTCYLITDLAKFVAELQDDFKVDNLLQLNMYLGSDFFQKRKYEYASLVYYVKNDSKMYELRFKFSPEMQELVKKKYQSAYDNGKSDPGKAEKTFWFGSIRCAFCPYKERCWSETSDPKYAYFQTLPKKRWPKDIGKLDNCEELRALFSDYENVLTQAESLARIELEIAKKLYNQKVSKIKLDNGNVWEVKTLKSQGLVLRKGKIK